MTARRRLVLPIALVASSALVLAGCAPSTTTPGTDGTGDRSAIQVVAVTDVYASVVQAIGGDEVEVTALISGSAQDPHEYEATARDQLAVAGADLIVMNGGGYDDFLTHLIEASGSAAHVITAVDASGLLPEDAETEEHDHEGETGDGEEHDHDAEDHADGDEDGHHHIEGFNEHVWYSLHGMEHIAEAIAEELTESGVAGAEAGLSAFLAELEAIHDAAHALEAELDGRTFLSTEPVAAYLLADLGLVDITPAEFLEAVEEGTGISVALLAEMLAVVEDGGVGLLAASPQAEGAEAEQIRAAATAAGIPTVEFSETLPGDQTYLSWMQANVEAVAQALR